jgi:hypothetical protein
VDFSGDGRYVLCKLYKPFRFILLAFILIDTDAIPRNYALRVDLLTGKSAKKEIPYQDKKLIWISGEKFYLYSDQ